MHVEKNATDDDTEIVIEAVVATMVYPAGTPNTRACKANAAA